MAQAIRAGLTLSILEDFKEIKSTPKELRQFGLTVGAVLVLLGGWSLWRGGAAGPYGASVGAILVVLGAWTPAVLRPLQRLWMALAVCMGFVMTRVILTVLYYGVITPVALVLRLSGKDVLDLKPRSAESHWQEHAEPDEQGPFRQF